MKTWILNRFKERSTWVGLVTVACSVGGLTLSPEQQQAVVTTGVAIIGLILAFTKDPAHTAVNADVAVVQPQPQPVVIDHPRTVRMPDGSVRPANLEGGDSPAAGQDTP